MICKRGSLALIVQVQQLLLLSKQQAFVDASTVVSVSQHDPLEALLTRVAPVTMKELA